MLDILSLNTLNKDMGRLCVWIRRASLAHPIPKFGASLANDYIFEVILIKGMGRCAFHGTRTITVYSFNFFQHKKRDG